MAKDSKTILELDRLESVNEQDVLPVARPSTAGDDSITIGQLIHFNNNDKTITLLGKYKIDVSELLVIKYRVQVGFAQGSDGRGELIGSGEYNNGSEIQISASPYHEYKFIRWDDGNTDNPRTVIVNKDLEINAVFEEKPKYTLIINFNDSFGSINCYINSSTEPLKIVDGEPIEAYENDVIKLVASAKNNYRFVVWTNQQDAQIHGNSIYEFSIVENKNINCVFDLNNHNVSANVCNDRGGSARVTDANDNEISSVPHGGTAIFKATPNSDWMFDGWYSNRQASGTKIDHSLTYERENITASLHLFANFKRTGAFDYYIGYVDGGLEVFQTKTDNELIENKGKYIVETPSVKLSGLTGEKTVYVIYKNNLAPNVIWKYANNDTIDKSTEFSNHAAPFQYDRNNSFKITINNVEYNIRIAYGLFSSTEEITFNFPNN